MKLKIIVRIIKVISLIFVFGIVIFLIFDKGLDFTPSERKSKRIEIKKSTISGYNNGLITWLVKADYIWAGRNNFLYRAEKVTSGSLYNSSGQMVMDKLKASKIKANSRSKVLSAYGDVSVYFIPEKNRDRSAEKDEDSDIRITCDELKYYSYSKKVYLKKNILIEQGDVKIKPVKGAEIDCDENLVYINGGFVMDSSELVVTADFMVINIDEEYSDISRNVLAVRKKEDMYMSDYDEREIKLRAEQTHLKCNYMKYSSKEGNREVTIRGDVLVTHGQRKLKGDRGVYDKNRNTFSIDGNVELYVESLDWLMDKTKKEGFRNEEMSEIIKKPAYVRCENLRFNAKTRTLELLRDISITQDDRKISCQKLTFNDQKGSVLLYGRVKLNDEAGNKDLRCHRLLIDINKEEFYADSDTEVEFLIE
ncbi:MAG: hypothetical protein GY730_07635 [bacterium]|nr:hypothetical protein [bacterium]